MSQVWIKGLVVLMVAGVCSLQLGCSASRTRAQSRAKVLEAEVIDLQQQADSYQSSMSEAQRRQDEAVAKLQQSEYEKAEYRNQAQRYTSEIAQANARAATAESRVDLATESAAAWKQRADLVEGKLEQVLEQRPVAAAPAPERRESWAPSPELEAMRSDLQGKLARNGIDMPVEIRTSRDGRRRVAVVIPDAFRSGEATLAYNADAVQAVVGLGRLVNDQYGGSSIMVEGHTDSDPLVRTKPKWGSNENLSLARATYVKKLLADTGVSESRIATAGLGGRHPIEPGATDRAKSRNRRVEVFIDP